jgi:hypothetical protein
VQPVRGRTAGRGRPALVTGVFLLVSSLALLVPPPASPDSPSFTSSRLADVLVQGRGAAAAVAALGGRSLATLPIVDGLLARVPAGKAPDLARQPGVRAANDADRPLRVRAADSVPLVATARAVDNPAPAPDASATLPVGAPPPGGEGAPRPGSGVSGSGSEGAALDAGALAALPGGLARRGVRAAARRAGVAPPDAAATDRVLALARAGDGDRTTWAGGSARREGKAVRLPLPPD